MKATVSLARAGSYDGHELLERMRACLAPLGGMAAFVRPGQRVLLKPNLLGAFHPDRAVTTHPSVLAAAITLAQECGGVVTVIDSPGTGSLASVARATGIDAVVRAAGATLGDETAVETFETPGNIIGRKLTLLKAVADADVLITLPKLKTHVQMTFTGAVKNQLGLVPGVQKGQYHFRLQNRLRLAELLLDINRTAKPALAIMDAVYGMEGNGPSGGEPRFIGALIASADLMALDVAACDLVGIDSSVVPTVQAGIQHRFGTTALDHISIAGEPLDALRVQGFRTVAHLKHVMRILPFPQFMLDWFGRHWAPRPRIDAACCVHCGACHRGCPVDPPAIDPEMPPARQVNDHTCIRCYCCHEFCPAKAILLRRSLADRIGRFTASLDWLTTRIPGI
ncbi:DUF362 domain-containing protein [bacterium]|nr:DUF362 domain-containing protein [bacterium]